MTVKVYLNDGSIEEYPNAHIYWEWDDNEEGADSGFRINSMDRNFTSAVAFVYPGDCEKIEITSEECDRVFKSPPRKDCMPINRYKIFRAIHEECIRQDEKWGEQNHPMLGNPEKSWVPPNDALQSALETCRSRIEKNPDWFNILWEEFLETFIETDPQKQRKEMIQVAAVAVQIIKYLDSRMEVKRETS
jgi:hypothetical protein